MLFKDDPAFADVIPVDLAEAGGPWPLAVIDVSESFTDCHAYFYALFRAGEKSKRCVKLTQDVIRHNSANYTAWYWRRKCLENMNHDDWSNSEIEFTNGWAIRSPKNYQVWFHRRWLVEHLKDYVVDLEDSELQYLSKVLDCDSKNYNAWAHRFFITTLFGSSASPRELEFTEYMLNDDVLNNSAWSYRRQLLDRMHPQGLPQSIIARERSFVLIALQLAPGNESAYWYLRSLPGLQTDQAVNDFLCDRHSDCRHTLMTKLEIARSRGLYGKELIDQLISVDPVREGYWNYLRS